MKNNTHNKQALSHDEIIQEILTQATNGNHDYAKALIDIAITDIRSKCSDSPLTLWLTDSLEKITSNRTNVKNAGKILGLSPPKGRPINPDKPTSDLYLAAQYYRQENSFMSKTETYGLVGENEFDSNGSSSKYEANAMRVYRACKIWEPLFKSNNMKAINSALVNNSLQPI